MKKSIAVVLCIFLYANAVHAQAVVADSVYHKRLFYTAKVWGFVKYFHSEVAKGNINWDKILFSTLERVKTDSSNMAFNASLQALIDSAGQMAFPTSGIPDYPESRRYNLDLSWIADPLLSDSVRTKLDTIRAWFRPHSNYYVGEVFTRGNPSFENDKQFAAEPYYPDLQYRLLALFRYWNIINYFYPYKYLMDQNWDTTLAEFIPKVISAYDEISYHKAFLQLYSRLNDTHAVLYGLPNSQIIDETIFGSFFLPLSLKYVENETVVTGILQDSTGVALGDIIKSVNGIEINTLRDSLRIYTSGSNDPVIERNINWWMLRGPENEEVKLLLENASGVKEITLKRNIPYNKPVSNNYDLFYAYTKHKSKWEILQKDSMEYGYVDMGKLQVGDINSMFNDLWNTDAIIFDIRDYPNATMWDMVRFLFDVRINIAKFTYPDIKYPGILNWISENVGSGDFSKTYDKNIFILFNELTQSQAEYTIMAFEQHPKAVKIGSQTSGADGNVSSISLPGGFTAYFSGLGVYYPDLTETQRIGIVPDIEVHPTIAGIRQGRDELLEEVFKYPVTGISGKDPAENIPATFLLQNFPNPFNPVTMIPYRLAVTGKTNLTIYNLLGQKVITLVNKKQPAGNYNFVWNASGIASGVYIYTLETDSGFKQSRKLILLK